MNKERIEPAQNMEIVIDEDHAWKSQEKRHVAGRGYGGFVDVAIGERTSFRLERVDWSICTQGLSAQAKLGLVETATEVGKERMMCCGNRASCSPCCNDLNTRAFFFHIRTDGPRLQSRGDLGPWHFNTSGHCKAEAE